jgi:hypothetical protein
MIAEAGFFALGLLAGTLHFALLRWNTALYARPGRVGRGAGLQVLRMAALASLLALAARYGALPLLLMAVGVLIARPAVMHVMAAGP